MSLMNLAQAIHLDHCKPSLRFLLTTSPSTASTKKNPSWTFRLYLSTAGTGLLIWSTDITSDDLPADERAVADAINGGYLHVDVKDKQIEEAKHIELQIHPPGEEIIRLKMDLVDDTGSGGVALLEATFKLLSRPSGPAVDKSELRALRSELTQKDAEIATLQSKLASAKATVVRATASDGKKKVMVSPKKPANASALQPNQKRRKAVEDEFAGSDSD